MQWNDVRKIVSPYPGSFVRSRASSGPPLHPRRPERWRLELRLRSEPRGPGPSFRMAELYGGPRHQVPYRFRTAHNWRNSVFGLPRGSWPITCPWSPCHSRGINSIFDTSFRNAQESRESNFLANPPRAPAQSASARGPSPRFFTEISLRYWSGGKIRFGGPNQRESIE